MNRFQRITTVLLSLIAALAGQPAWAENITVFIAKKIYTMDPGWPEATAVAIRGGKVLSVGSMEDLKPWLDKYPYTIDKTFADKILLPGFVEPHGHPTIGAMSLTRPLLTYMPVPNPYGPAFPGVKTREQALAKLSEYSKATKSPDETVLAWGYDTIAMGGQQLDKTTLDKISATQPIIVWDCSEHFAFANSAALKKYGVTRADEKILGVEAGPDGDPDGRFLGALAAQRILEQPLAALLAPPVALKNTKFLMDLSSKNGITTTSEMAMGLVNMDVELALLKTYFNDPQHAIRAVVVTDGLSATEQKKERAIEFVKSLQAQSTDKLIFNGVKFFADDAFLSLGMSIVNPGYTDGHEGIFLTPPDQMVPRWLPWWKEGFHIHVHTNGNGGNEATANALDGLMKAFPRTDHRFTFEHFGISTPELARKIHVLGGVVSINPYYLYARSELTAPFIGSERAYTAARLRTLENNGVITSLHTDTPVATPIPLEEVWIAVNRFGLSGTVRGPSERVAVDQALRMVTTNAAYTLGVEDKVGTIMPGKFADFAVLEQDPYTVPSEHLRDIKVWGTVFGGVPHPNSAIHP